LVKFAALIAAGLGQKVVAVNSPVVLALKVARNGAELSNVTVQACGLAKAAVAHAIEVLIHTSSPALQAVRLCEEKLDVLDRDLDEQLAPAIAQASPKQARELLACMKLIIDLERVSDLVAGFAERALIVRTRIDMDDVKQLTRMASLIENMLAQMEDALETRSVEQAIRVLRADSEIDRLRNLLLVRHTENPEGLKGQESLHVVLMANSLERAGDHLKNMAEELCHLATGHTVRHVLRAKDKPVEQLYLDWLAQQDSSG
jgi:phosphate transport system protein